jgi:hypothetical protein
LASQQLEGFGGKEVTLVQRIKVPLVKLRPKPTKVFS